MQSNSLEKALALVLHSQSKSVISLDVTLVMIIHAVDVRATESSDGHSCQKEC